MKKYKLVTPSGEAIVGIKGKDGEIISCTHINRATDGLGERTVVYQVSNYSRIPKKILIDEDSVEWTEIDIWHVSIK